MSQRAKGIAQKYGKSPGMKKRAAQSLERSRRAAKLRRETGRTHSRGRLR